MFMKQYAPNRCEPSIEALNFSRGDQGRCERRSEVFVKLLFFFFFFFLGGGGGGGGGQGRCERRSEVFLENSKTKNSGGGGGGVGLGGVRVDVSREVKCL